MLRIPLEMLVRLIRELLNVLRQRPITGPIVWSRVVIQRGVDFPDA